MITVPGAAGALRDGPEALAAIERVLAASPGMLVAFSGGVDSAVLTAVARRVLGDRVAAFTADSPSMPRRELRRAVAFAAGIGVVHVVRQTSEMALPAYRENDRNRCYWCKHTLFDVCERVAGELGFTEVAYGYTADDVGEHRPGHRAATEFGVRSPLLEAGLRKAEIRAVAQALGLEVWDKPAAPCLSSRIPYGSEVSVEKLGRIEAVEDLLDEMGFRLFRARFDGREMRIEVGVTEIERAASAEVRARILALAQRLGVPLVTLDLEGFRSGKLNDPPRTAG
jgi:pyridinium-3,5-biscarboxylic acid mononucleotide sulfurtransferase